MTLADTTLKLKRKKEKKTPTTRTILKITNVPPITSYNYNKQTNKQNEENKMHFYTNTSIISPTNIHIFLFYFIFF